MAWLEPDGTLKRKAFSGPTRAAVKDRMDELRRELAAGRQPTKAVTVRRAWSQLVPRAADARS